MGKGVEQDTALHDARARVANRYPQPYHQHAIMRGEWDNGSIVRDELAKVLAERKEALEKGGNTPQDEG